MAKNWSDHKKKLKAKEKARFYFERKMSEIDREYKKIAPKKPGPREIILDVYKKNGINGAMLAFRILNKRVDGAYTWEDVEKWIKEEDEKAGIEK